MVLIRFCTPELRWGSLSTQPVCGNFSETRHQQPCVSSLGGLCPSSKARLATLRNGLWGVCERTGRFSCSAALNEGIGSVEQDDEVVEVTTTSEGDVVEEWGADPSQKDWDGAAIPPKKKRGIVAAIVGVFILIGGTLAAIQAIGAYKASDAYNNSAAPAVSNERSADNEQTQTQTNTAAGAVEVDEIEESTSSTGDGGGGVKSLSDATAVAVPVKESKEGGQSDNTPGQRQKALDVEVSESDKFEVDSAASDFQSSPSGFGGMVASVFTDEVKESAEAKAAGVIEKVEAPITAAGAKAAETLEAVEAAAAAESAKAVEMMEAAEAVGEAEAKKAAEAFTAAVATQEAEAKKVAEALAAAVEGKEAEAKQAAEALTAAVAVKEAEAKRAAEALAAAGAAKEAEAKKIAEGSAAAGAAREAELMQKAEAAKAEAARLAEGVKMESTGAVAGIRADAKKSVAGAKDESTKVVDGMRAEAEKAAEAVRALEERAKMEPVARVGLAREIVQPEEAVDVEPPPKPSIEIAGAVSEEQVAQIAAGKSVDDLRQRAILAARASTVASEAARRAAAYATVSSSAASQAALAAERGASATGAALAAMELGAEEAIAEAERRAMKAAELAAEAEKRAAEAAGLASAHKDVADRQAEIAEELSQLHKSRTTELVENIRNTVTAFCVETRDFAFEAAAMIKQWVINLAHGLRDFFPALLEKCEAGEKKFVASWNNLWSSVGNFFGNLSTSIQNQCSSAGEFVREMATSLTQFSRNLIAAIGSALGKSWETIGHVYEKIVVFFKGFVENFK